MAKISLNTITNGNNLSAINNNFTALANALNLSVLYRANPVGEPNAMTNDIDMNGHGLLNINTLSVTSLTVNGLDVTTAVAQAKTAATNAAASALVAQGAATSAQGSAAQAATDAANAVATANTASATANGIDAKATTALANSSSAVSTANAASTSAGNAVTTANSASTAASNAQTTANTANTTANAAVIRNGDTMTGPLVLSGAPTIGLHAATKTYVDTLTNTALSRVKRFVANNNSGTPLTQMDMSAGSVLLINASGAPVIRNATGTLTCNISTAGSTANGRDQAGAFSSNAEVHFFFIWNGTTLATLASLSSTSPTLPAGYTHWAYAFSVKLNTTNLYSVHVLGDKVTFDTPTVIGTPTSSTTASFSIFVPSVAESWDMYGLLGITAEAGGNAYATLGIQVTGVHAAAQTLVNLSMAGVAGSIAEPGRWANMPNGAAGSIGVTITVSNGSAPTTTLQCVGYTVPNY